LTIEQLILVLVGFPLVLFAVETAFGDGNRANFLEKNRKNMNRWQIVFLMYHDIIKLLSGLLVASTYTIFMSSLEFNYKLMIYVSGFCFAISIFISAIVVGWQAWLKGKKD
jgi:membrane-associated HD superfamily phosphohydrolase